MKLSFTAIIDDEVRKQIQEQVLGEAKKVARSLIDLTIKSELERLAKLSVEKVSSSTWNVERIMRDAFQSVVAGNYSTYGQKIEKLAEEAVERYWSKKARTEDREQIQAQEAFIRQTIREELTKILGNGLKG